MKLIKIIGERCGEIYHKRYFFILVDDDIDLAKSTKYIEAHFAILIRETVDGRINLKYSVFSDKKPFIILDSGMVVGTEITEKDKSMILQFLENNNIPFEAEDLFLDKIICC